MSDSHAMSVGTLYVVPTPIGNLEDITLRALRVLQEVDFIAAEDTRHTRKLLTHFAIRPKQFFSYHEHNVRTAGESVIRLLQAGYSGALVSDAGMPAISDPGFDLIALLVAEQLPYVVLPGPNAAMTALVGSGLDTKNFSFHGFLPRVAKERRAIIEQLRGRSETLIFYEAPHRIDKMLADLYEGLGNCPVVIAKELTKHHECYVRGRLAEHQQLLPEEMKRGEMVVLVGADPQWDPHVTQNHQSVLGEQLSIAEHVAQWMAEGLTQKEAMREVAKARSISRRDVYRALLENKS